MTGEDLIESVASPKPAWRLRLEGALHHPTAAAALLVLGLVAGAAGGFVVGHSNPRELAGAGYVYIIGSYPAEQGPLELKAFEQTYGRTPPPALAPEDLAAIGERVTSYFTVLSARSAIPVMCGTSIGQPGSANSLDLSYPAVIFRVDGGEISQLSWPRADETVASAALHTLVFQAQQCPEVPEFQARIGTSGVRTGIGDEYAVFTRSPAVPGQGDADVVPAVLVRVGADLIEIAFTSGPDASPDAEARCLRVALAAAQLAAGE